MTVSQVHEALGSFSVKLKRNIPREVLDSIEYFGHVAIIPGRMDARIYGDATLDAARYVGVLRKRQIGDDGQTDQDQVPVTLSGVGMNFWLGDEEDKGAVIEEEIQYISENFSSAVSGLLPPAVKPGNIGGVDGTYSGIHQWQTPRKAIQYICDTMSQPATAPNLISDDNSSFEGTGGVSGWDTDNCNTAVTGSYSYLGTKSMLVTPLSSGDCSVSSASSSDAVDLEAGKTYVLTYWILPLHAGCYAKMEMDFRDNSYFLISSAPTSSFVSLPANTWTQISRTVTVPTTGGITKGTVILDFNAATSDSLFLVDVVAVNENTEPIPVSFRVNNDATLDAGPESDLFVTDPTCILVRRDGTPGEDLTIKAVPGSIELDQDMEDFATRVVVLAGSDGTQFSTGSADIGSVSPESNVFKDMYGQPLRLTKMVSESETSDDNADVRAELNLRETLAPHREINLSTEDFDVYGSFDVGDYIYIYDPDSDLVDTANEVYVRGIRLNPIKLQVTELEWPVTSDYSMAYRGNDGTWYDLTDYVEWETDTSNTKVTVGDFQRTLDDNLQDVTTRLGQNITPDSSTPGAPDWVTGSFQTTTYLDSNGYAKASQKVVWNQPANTDGSLVTDGSYYEINFRLNTGHLYSQTWGAVSTLTWGSLNTWEQPVAADSSQWESRIVAFDTTSFIINDLAAGTIYDIRIRAVDTSNNIGDWSAIEIFTTATDNIPPSQPAAPEVASSLIAVQVTHELGKIDGGTFNLEPDLAALEVHVSTANNFEPDSTTRVGLLRANQGMMRAEAPAVGTFQVTNTEDVWVKVVAIDISGNRSEASPAVQASAELIDDEHISSLTVSKITAGEITADWLLSGSIRTGVEGQRVELNSQGLQAYNANGDLTTNLSSDPGASGQFIGFTDETGNSLASISSQGVGSFQSLNTDALNLAGRDLQTDILDPMGKGVVAWGFSLTDVTGASSGETGFIELAFNAEPNRMYKVEFICDIDSDISASSNTKFVAYSFHLRDGGTSIPTTSSTNVATNVFRPIENPGSNVTGRLTDIRTYSPGIHRLLITFSSSSGYTPTMRGNDGPALFWVEDMGDVGFFNNTAYLNPGDGTTTAPALGGGNFTATYDCTWSGSYAGIGPNDWDTYQYMDDYLDRIAQGQYDASRGNQRSLIGLPSSQIVSDMTGATVSEIRLVMYMPHSFYDYGTDCVIGTHDYTSRPGYWATSHVFQDRMRYYGWPKNSTRAVTLTSDMVDDIISGDATGIAIGPGPTSDIYYYSYFNGADPSITRSNRPYIEITYSK